MGSDPESSCVVVECAECDRSQVIIANVSDNQQTRAFNIKTFLGIPNQ